MKRMARQATLREGYGLSHDRRTLFTENLGMDERFIPK